LLIVLATSPRVAPGLLSWPAWEALRSADIVLAPPGHPQLPALEAAGIACQVAGAIGGAALADAMFSEPVLAVSRTHRGGPGVLLGEVVATAGLLLVIVALARTGRSQHAGWAVGAWIGAAYWFTSSTSFANPAVTLGRALTSTYAGIAPSSVPAFIAAQIAGGTLGTGLAMTLFPARRRVSDETGQPSRLAG